MALEMIVGPAGSGKSDYALEKILQYQPAEWAQSVRYIVPTIRTVRQVEERLLQKARVSGILGNVVTTFYSFANEFITQAGFSGQLISDIQKSIMLGRLVADSSLSYFKQAAEYPGFVAALGEIIGEMKISLVTPEDLDNALRNASGELDQTSFAKITELATLYKRYQKEILEGHLIHDREGLMWRALEILPGSQVLDNVKEVIFAGFQTFTPVQKEFLRFVSSKVNSVSVLVSYDKARPEVFAPVEDTLKFLIELGAVEKKQIPDATVATSLDHLKHGIFSASAEKVESDGSICLIEGGIPVIEAQLVADEIRRLVRDNGYSPSDIAVVGRDIEQYKDRLERIFGDSGIDIEASSRPLSETAVARLLIDCLDTVSGGWKREQVFRILKSELLSNDISQACHAEVNARQAGILQGREKWLEEWPDQKDRTQEFRASILEPLVEFENALASSSCACDCISAVKSIVSTFKRRTHDHFLLSEDSAAVRAINSALDELAATENLLQEKICGKVFIELFKMALSQAEYKLPRLPKDAVNMLSASAIGGQKFRAVFVVGMLEKVFPRQIREESFLRDQERRVLNNHFRYPVKERLVQQDVERLIFFNAIACAEEKLYFSYPLADESAKDSLPSFYLDEVKKVFSSAPRTIRRDISNLVPAVSEAECRKTLEQATVYALAHKPHDASLEAIAAYNHFPEESFRMFQTVFRDSEEKQAAIDDASVVRSISMDYSSFRCTELETYAACAFMHFCQSVLGLEPIRDEVGALDAGGMLHQVLFKLMSDLRCKYGSDFIVRTLDVEETIKAAYDILDQEFENNPRFLNLLPHEADLEKHTFRLYLKRYLSGEITRGLDGFSPSFFELEFGSPARPDRPRDPRSTDEPLVIRGEDGTEVLLRGKIDRVDINSNGGVVIDYKLGNTSMTKFKKGLTFQAVVYAIALDRLLGIKPLGVEYRPFKKWAPDGYYSGLDGVGKRGRSLPEDEFSQMLKKCEEYVLDYVRGIREAQISVAPKDCKDYCAYRSVCRTDDFSQLLMGFDSEESNEEAGI